MERSITRRFAARTVILGWAASTITVAGIASAQPQDPAGYGHRDLPETTACLNTAITAGRNNAAYSGFAVAVLLDGRVVYRRGFGTVSPASAQPVQPSTRFRFGSIAKAMTATAVLSLAEERQLHLRAPANVLLPGLELIGEPGWSDKLNAHLLLTHQAAITDSSPLYGPQDDSGLATAFYDPAYLQTVPLLVAPGTFWNYSNPNYSLAGLLAETAAGKPYRQVMRERVFKPLGMKRTTFLNSDVLQDNDFAYGLMGQTVWAPGDYENTILRPAGFGWTSIDDLAKYGLFILHGDRNVLSPRMWRTLQTEQVNMRTTLDLEHYSYGLLIASAATLFDRAGQPHFYNGLRVVAHDGAIPGYRAFMTTLPAQRFGYVVLVNGDATNPGVSQPAACIHAAIAETVGNRLPPTAAFPDPDIQRERFNDYVGTYADRLGFGQAIVTRTPAGDLHMELPLLDAVGIPYSPVLQPLSRDNFVLQIGQSALLLTGFRGSGEEMEYLRLRLTVFARSQIGAAASRATPSLDRKALEQLIREAAVEHNPLLKLNP